MYIPRYLLIAVLVTFAYSKSTNFAYPPCQCSDGSGQGALIFDCAFDIRKYVCGPGIGGIPCCQDKRFS